MDSEVINAIIVLKHDTSSEWNINDPILAFGEYGIEDDTHKVKRGDGKTEWSKLPYDTFGLESLISTDVNSIAYTNDSLGGVSNVKEALDKIIDAIPSIGKVYELIENKVDKVDDDYSESTHIQYPTVNAMITYVHTGKLADTSSEEDTKTDGKKEEDKPESTEGSKTEDVNDYEAKINELNKVIDSLKAELEEAKKGH